MSIEFLSDTLSTSPTRASALGVSPFARAGSALTIAVPIQAARADALERYLRSIGDAIRDNTELRFGALKSVHFMRWVVVRKGPKTGKDYLLFESNHDGTPEQHLRDLIQAGPEALRKIYGHCVGCDGERLDDQGLTTFLLRHRLPSQAFYSGYPGKLAQRIALEKDVRERLQTYLDRHDARLRRLSPTLLYRELKAHVAESGLLQKLSAPQPAAPKRSKAKTVLSLVPSGSLFIGLLPVVAPVLFYKERTDEPWDLLARRTEQEEVPELKSQEDRVVQNQLTHVVSIKPGPVRRYLLKFVLGAIGRLARHHFNQGDLGGIPTIHFARWVILEEEGLLVFFSNYDGSWENYLGDFIDIAATGLTTVWTNTVGFPRTRWLVKEGARDEERFKSWTRAHQVYTEVWYSAHPDLTVRNVLQNAAIARGLIQEPKGEQAIAQWLGLL